MKYLKFKMNFFEKPKYFFYNQLIMFIIFFLVLFLSFVLFFFICLIGFVFLYSIYYLFWWFFFSNIVSEYYSENFDRVIIHLPQSIITRPFRFREENLLFNYDIQSVGFYGIYHIYDFGVVIESYYKMFNEPFG